MYISLTYHARCYNQIHKILNQKGSIQFYNQKKTRFVFTNLIYQLNAPFATAQHNYTLSHIMFNLKLVHPFISNTLTLWFYDAYTLSPTCLFRRQCSTV